MTVTNGGKKKSTVLHTRDTVDMTSRVWTEEEIRRAQLRVAEEALRQPKRHREKWLAETLDMLGLLPTNKNHIARFRTNMTSVALRHKPRTEETDDTRTDMERTTSRVVDTHGHGTVAGYDMHIKRYERPCDHCQFARDLDVEHSVGERGIILSDNHTIGYQ